MFDRYTESARRVLFFSRYEASQFGSACIDTEHLLLALVRQPKREIRRLLDGAGLPPDAVRAAVEPRVMPWPKTNTAIEIPFSETVRRILRHTEEEADVALSQSIDDIHLLRGLLREAGSTGAAVLIDAGITLSTARAASATAIRLVPFDGGSSEFSGGFEVGFANERLHHGSVAPWEALEGASQVVRADRHVWVAGTMSRGDDGAIVGVGDAYAQTSRALHNVGELLAGVNASLRDVVRTRLYVVNLARDRAAISRAHGEVFTSLTPAATIVQVTALAEPDALVAVEADAFLPSADVGATS